MKNKQYYFFWNYDVYPYLLGGIGHWVTEHQIECPESYGKGFRFFPVMAFENHEHGKAFHKQLNKLQANYEAARELLRRGAEDHLNVTTSVFKSNMSQADAGCYLTQPKSERVQEEVAAAAVISGIPPNMSAEEAINTMSLREMQSLMDNVKEQHPWFVPKSKEQRLFMKRYSELSQTPNKSDYCAGCGMVKHNCLCSHDD